MCLELNDGQENLWSRIDELFYTYMYVLLWDSHGTEQVFHQERRGKRTLKGLELDNEERRSDRDQMNNDNRG